MELKRAPHYAVDICDHLLLHHLAASTVFCVRTSHFLLLFALTSVHEASGLSLFVITSFTGVAVTAALVAASTVIAFCGEHDSCTSLPLFRVCNDERLFPCERTYLTI